MMIVEPRDSSPRFSCYFSLFTCFGESKTSTFFSGGGDTNANEHITRYVRFRVSKRMEWNMEEADIQRILSLHIGWLRSDGEGQPVNLQDADLRSADLRSTDLRSADLRYANLQSANLQSANLQSTDLRYANLQDADLRSTDLRSTDLRSANLRSANLQDADLQSTDLRYVNLQDADLRSANLRYANLQSANLQSANLQSTDLRYANLQDADLRSADLRYADLQSAPALLTAQWGEISDKLCQELMRYDAANHPNPELFDTWANNGACPMVKGWQRAANFTEKRELWSPGPSKPAIELVLLLFAEKGIKR